MTRNLKALGLALIAVFAMSALVASAAQAEFTFTGWETNESTHVHTTFKSAQTGAFSDAFQVTSGKTALRCQSANGEGTSTTGDDATVTLAVIYSSNCSAAEIQNTATVEPTSCHFRFHVTGKHTEHEYTGTADVFCTTPGDSIHVTIWTSTNHSGAPTCEITIPEQNGINGITYTNITGGAKKTIQVDINATNVTTNMTKGGILCGESTGVTATTGTFVGTDVVSCFNSVGTQINCTVSG
jgi:hypothetical protein